MVALDFEPKAAGLKLQTIPLAYGCLSYIVDNCCLHIYEVGHFLLLHNILFSKTTFISKQTLQT